MTIGDKINKYLTNKRNLQLNKEWMLPVPQFIKDSIESNLMNELAFQNKGVAEVKSHWFNRECADYETDYYERELWNTSAFSVKEFSVMSWLNKEGFTTHRDRSNNKMEVWINQQ